MQRQIELLGKQYMVTAINRPEKLLLQVDSGNPLPASLIQTANGRRTIRLGDNELDVEMTIKGETVYIHAFNRTFVLTIIDPVEQAVQENGGGSNSARAPMPGVVVDINVAAGDTVSKGQSLMTIESMKILTIITAPRDGIIDHIYFSPGDTFAKNDALISLIKNEEE